MHISGRGGLLGRSALVICVSTLVSCRAGSIGPTETSTTNSSNSAVRGSVTEALTGSPIDGATLSFTLAGAPRTLTTSGGGGWELAQGSIASNVLIEVSAPGYLTRRTHLLSVTTRGGVSIDLIRDGAPFSLEYYRQLVRNQFDAPGTLQPLRRWTRNPTFYINTRNPRTGQDLATSERESMIAIIRASVPQMTGGQLAAGGIEFGSGARAEKAGGVSMTLVEEPDNQFCGWSRVGADPGAITLNVASRCETPCGAIAPRTVAHEVGHALGFYHVERGDVLSTNWSHRDCGVTTFSVTEQHHARLAYARQPGNRDTDFDPLFSLGMHVAAATSVIACR